MISWRVFGRQFCARANPTLKALGIADDSAFHKLAAPTRQELIALYNSGLTTNYNMEHSLAQLLHFEEPTATKIIHDFRTHTKVPRLEMGLRPVYLAGFIRKARESAEGLQSPPTELNASAFEDPEELSSRQFLLDQQLLLADSKKELVYLESPVMKSLQKDKLQERYMALFNTLLRFTHNRDFVPPFRVQPVANVFRSFVKHSRPERVVCEAMVSVYSRGLQPENTLVAYRIMKALGYEVDISIFNALLFSCSNGAKEVWKVVLEEMAAEGVELNAVSYEYLIVACERNGDDVEAIEFYATTKRNHMKLGEKATAALLATFQHLNLRPQGEEQYRRLQELRGGEVPEDPRRLNLHVGAMVNIMLLRLRANDLEGCLKLREEAVEEFQSADLCSLIIKAYCDTQHSKEAIEFFSSLPKELTSEKSFFDIFVEYRKQGNFPKMEQMFEMAKITLPSDHCKPLYLGFIHVLCWQRMYAKVPPLWEEFKQRVARISAEQLAREELLKADRVEWISWQIPYNPLKDVKTYFGLLRICTEAKHPAEWEADLLPFTLSMMKEASLVQPSSEELNPYLQAVVQAILKVPGLSGKHVSQVKATAKELGLSEVPQMKVSAEQLGVS